MNLCRLSKIIVACLALALFLPAPAHAASCSISSISGVGFGSYDVLDSHPLDSAGTITINCSSVQLWDLMRVDLDKGVNGNSAASRKMAYGSYRMNYNLYMDAARLLVWGDGNNGTVHYGPILPPSGQLILNVYGRVPALQNLASGSYTDSVLVTVYF